LRAKQHRSASRAGCGRAHPLLGLADRPIGTVILILLAFLEATVFPGPTEAMLVALTLGRRERALRFAILAILASVVGGIVGYYLGAALFPDVVGPLLESYGLATYTDSVRRAYAENTLVALATSGYTPIPYMLYTSMAGAAQLPVPEFVFGSFLGRALKYAPIAWLAYLFGPRVHWALRRYGAVAAVAVVSLLVLWMML
jgi:membrane protein YqaA with SNARE-associated domain